MTISLGDHMQKPTKILLFGAVAAFIVFGIGMADSLIRSAHVSNLIAQCQSENTRAAGIKYQDGWESAPMICDLKELKNDSRYLSSGGIQSEIVDASYNTNALLEQAKMLAFGIFIFSALPHAWYFLLRRVRELRDAVAGK